MAKRDKKRKPNAEGPGKSSLLEKLDGAESASVLKALVDQHPELRSEAEALGKEVLGEVSLFSVADDVENAALQFDYDDLNSRAGSHSWGYVEPTEAAWELLEEAVEPFVSEMKRYLDLGLEEQSREVCQGILLGLYRVQDGQSNDVLGWAEDFPGEAAANALEVWMSASGREGALEGRKPRRLSSEFVREHLPNWDWVLKPGAED
jgi:hypothetical protein